MFSISAGYALNPPTMNMSFLRSVMREVAALVDARRRRRCAASRRRRSPRRWPRGRRSSPASRCSRGRRPRPARPAAPRCRRRRRRCTSTPGIARPDGRRDRLGVVVVAAHRRDAGRLGEPVAGDDRLEPELVAHAPDQLDRHRRRAGDREPQRRQVELGEVAGGRGSTGRSVGGPGSIETCSSATRRITAATSNTACGTIVAPLMRLARMPGLQPERVEERVDDEVAVAVRAARPRRTTRRTRARSRRA